MFDSTLAQRLHDAGLIAVLVIENESDAVPVAEALYEGGVRAIELALRTPTALRAIERIRVSVPEMMIGAGTVLRVDQVREVKAINVDFAVAPGTNPRVLDAARAAELSFAPGVATPTDLEIAAEAGCRVVKFFPAAPLGGVEYLRSIAAPFAHLGMQYIPLGGVSANNLETYLREPCVNCVGGSWIAPHDLIAARDWKSITKRSLEATSIATACRTLH